MTSSRHSFLPLTFIAGLLLLPSMHFVNGSSTSELFMAFAGGFGATESSKKAKSKKKKGTLISEIPITAVNKTKDNEKGPRLDRWGLPEPTIEDIFPLLPPDTELLPATKDSYSLAEIEAALKLHIPLTLRETFDENCIEKTCVEGRTPMKLRLLHISPPVLAIDDYFSAEECRQVEQVMQVNTNDAVQVESKTFALAQSKRTSTSWFCHYKQLPTLIAKTHYRFGIPIERMEEPQVVRYKTGQEFSWHYDEVPSQQLSNGGQRVMTLLVYLNTAAHGGGTTFRDLKDQNGNELVVQPVEGSALIFFPAFANGRADDRTLHRSQPALDEKRIVQMWVHERSYEAILPPGNRQELAKAPMEDVARKLGYLKGE